MTTERERHRISPPRIYLLRMLVFLVLVGFVALILYRQIVVAFNANPGLNAIIIGVMAIGIVLTLRQVWRLFSEARWVNGLGSGLGSGLGGEDDGRVRRGPVLLAPMEKMLGQKHEPRISTLTLRAILDSVEARLDEARETSRYLTGVLVFLGLLGTFWGLIETVGSIGAVIRSMGGGADASVMFDELKNGLSAPIAGMAISFTSSLFGLAGSMVLGFLDLQAGQAQNRFYTELEDFLSAGAVDPTLEGAPVAEGARGGTADSSATRASTAAMANLAEGIQGLVKHMRTEQQQIREWVEAQAEQQREMRKVLDRLASEREKR
jgi:hypothetical protein